MKIKIIDKYIYKDCFDEYSDYDDCCQDLLKKQIQGQKWAKNLGKWMALKIR